MTRFVVSPLSGTTWKVKMDNASAVVSYNPETDALVVLSGKLFEGELTEIKAAIKAHIRRGF